MEFMSYLAPIAFVFSLAAIAQVNKLKSELESLRDEVDTLQDK